MRRVERRVGVAGAAVVGVAFGMARYAYGLTLPGIRRELGLSETELGLVASSIFAGYLGALLLAEKLADRRGPRAPTIVGSACGAAGCAVVAAAPDPVVLVAGGLLAGSAAGWVWSPYSDIIVRISPRRRRRRLLAAITTGTSGGLVVLGAVALAIILLPTADLSGWRLVWGVTAAAAAVAGLANVAGTPRLSPRAPVGSAGTRSLVRREMAAPLGYAAVYFTATTIYLTYAADAASSAGLPRAAGPGLFVVIGLTGTVALFTGWMAGRLGPARTAGACVGAVCLSLVVLGVAPSLVTAGLSAVLFGAGYMTGSAVLAVWTAEVAPDRPGAGFATALVVGAAASAAAPAVAGASLNTVGLGNVLLVTAAFAGATGAVLLGVRRRAEAPAPAP